MNEMRQGGQRYSDYVDITCGLVNRKIFADEEIYQTELRQIFGRCWLYLVHESEIPEPGDYVNVMMGTESVIVCRGLDRKINAFLNSCRHRGNRVCRADRGNANTFVCSYHGWAYNLEGKNVGIPGKKGLYFDAIRQEDWGLINVSQVDSYKGMVFATFDPEAPSLDTYLGDMRWALDMMLDQGDLVAVPGITRWSMECNWKFAADNAIGDMYHASWTHLSAKLAGHRGGNGFYNGDRPSTRQSPGFTLITEYGHGCTADFFDPDKVDWSSPLADWRKDPVVQQRLGPTRNKVQRSNMNVFPNLFVNSGSREIMLRNPTGPGSMEIWKTVLVDRNASPEVQKMQVRLSNRHFGPAGMFEQDDGENWAQSTLGALGKVSQQYDLHYAMGLGRGELVEEGDTPPLLKSLVNEYAQLWMYRCWAEFMDAPSWNELQSNHSIPHGKV